MSYKAPVGYYSALGKEEDAEPKCWYECDSGTAHVHDLSAGIPAAMYKASVWYADLPWRAGFEKFGDRAGKPQSLEFSTLMGKINRLILAAEKPAVMVTGRHAKAFFNPDAVSPCILNGSDAIAMLWKIRPFKGKPTGEQILANLALEFSTVGDFCCGYGTSGRIFKQAGRSFVLSDLSAKCIGHIAAHEKDW